MKTSGPTFAGHIMYITEIEFKQDNKGRNSGNLTLNIRTIHIICICTSFGSLSY